MGRKPQSGRRYSRLTFYRMFFSFLAVSALFLLTGTAALYTYFERLVIEQINQKSLEMLRQSDSLFGSMHQWTVSSFVRFRLDEAVDEVLNAREPGNQTLVTVIDAMDDMKGSHPLLHSIYLYNGKADLYLSTIRGLEDSITLSDPAVPKLIARIGEYGVYRYIPREFRLSDVSPVSAITEQPDRTSRVFTMVFGDLDLRSSSLDSAIVVNMREEAVREFILDEQGSGENRLWILDSSGAVVSSPIEAPRYTDEEVAQGVRNELNKGESEGSLLVELDGAEVLLSYIKNRDVGWTFASVTPREELFGAIITARNASIYFLILLTFLSTIATLLLSSRISKPIYGLIDAADRLRSRLGTEQEATGNVSGIEMAIDTVRALSRRLEAYELERASSSRERTFQELLLGYETEPDKQQVEESLPLIPCVLTLDYLEELRSHLGAESIKEIHSSLLAISREVLSAGESYAGVALDIGESRVTLLLRDTPFALVRTIQERVAEELRTSVSVGYSAQADGESDLRPRFHEALTAADYAFLYGPNALIAYVPAMAAEPDVDFPEEAFAELGIALRRGDPAAAVQRFASLSEKWNHLGPEGFALFRQLLLYHSRRELLSLEERRSDQYASLSRELQELRHVANITELRQSGSSFFEGWATLRQQQTDQRHKKVVETVREKMETEFPDSSLCSDSLSALVGLSTDYVRELFKRETGESMSEYLNRIRFAHCKERLQKSEEPVKEIFAEAGFANHSYAVTVFKRQTGLTPLQYRRLHSTDHRNQEN